jgi:hypothetical protein
VNARDEGCGFDRALEHSPQAEALRSPMGLSDYLLAVYQVEVVSDVGGHQGEGLVQQGSTLDEVGGDFPRAPSTAAGTSTARGRLPMIARADRHTLLMVPASPMCLRILAQRAAHGKQADSYLPDAVIRSLGYGGKAGELAALKGDPIHWLTDFEYSATA